MKKLIIIEFAESWVFMRRNDGVLPIPTLRTAIFNRYTAGLKVLHATHSRLMIIANEEVNAEEVKMEAWQAFVKHYVGEEIKSGITVKIEDYVEEDDEDEVEEEILVEEKARRVQSEAEKALERINELVGAEEFKALAKEMVMIAPHIIEHKTFDIFTYQSYIFSVNEGYGLTTYLERLAELVGSLRIKPLSTSNAVTEIKLPPQKGESNEVFEDALKALSKGRKDALQVLCIDVSEWINDTNSKKFKHFLSEIEGHLSEFIIVFRIPFVDKEVLENIRYSLGDIMFVRTVSFPPFNRAELKECATRELKKFGFSVTREGWPFFLDRLNAEKTDGRFYGLNTIRKVVREVLYKAQLKSAKRGKAESVIGKKDMMTICGRTEKDETGGFEMLDKLVGGEKVKEQIRQIVSQIELARADKSLKSPCIHMRFVGNPGTGKTTVARILGKILKERGVLRVGGFFEYAGRDFCGRYIGETAPKTSSMCRDAYGSVLFIDEAYSLYRGDGNDRDYGREALETLIAEMENHRSDLVVIMAGYTDEMETLMHGNAGLASRMPYVLEFPNFTREELFEIFAGMAKGKFVCEEGFLEAAKEYFLQIPQAVLDSKEFSNARFVRNLYERTWAKAVMRCQLGQRTEITLTKDDFKRSVSDKEFKFNEKKKSRLGFFEE